MKDFYMNSLLNNDSNSAGIYRAILLKNSKDEIVAFVPGIDHSRDKSGNFDPNAFTTTEFKDTLPVVQWCAFNKQSCVIPDGDVSWVMFENGDTKRPVVVTNYLISGGIGVMLPVNDDNLGGEYNIAEWLALQKDGVDAVDQDDNGIECVDLVKKYLKEVFGITNVESLGDGKDVSKSVGTKYNDKFDYIEVTNNKVTLMAGDIVSGYIPNGRSEGHVMIVKSVSGDTISIIEYYSSSGEYKELSGVLHEKNLTLAGVNLGSYVLTGIARPKTAGGTDKKQYDTTVANKGTKAEKIAFLWDGLGLPTSPVVSSQYTKSVTFKCNTPVGASTHRITVHKKLAGDVEKIFEEIFNIGFLISSDTCGYNWRLVRGSSTARSHHSYGTAIDVNPANNPMTTNQSVINNWYASNNQYKVTPKVVEIFAKYGWSWGGNWNNLKDFMHFTYLGG